jgi:hypothetical protein
MSETAIFQQLAETGATAYRAPDPGTAERGSSAAVIGDGASDRVLLHYSKIAV